MALVVLMASLGVVATAHPAGADPITHYDVASGWVWTADPDNVADGATITSYFGSVLGSSATVPASFTDEGTTWVTRHIGDFGIANADDLTSLTLPDTIVSFGEYAFGESEFPTLDLPDQLQTIGKQAFYDSKLTSVTIPNSVTSMGTEAFRQSQLTSVQIGTGLTSIPDNAFESNAITALTIPTNITAIGDGAFANNAIETLTIPASVTALGESSFASNQLTSLTLPNTISTLPAGVFTSNLLTSVTIPASVTTIDRVAFTGNHLGTITIPDTVTTLGDSAFSDNRLTSATVSDNVTAIPDLTFAFNRLTSVHVGDSVATVGTQAFRDNRLQRVDFPASLTSVGDFAFGFNDLCLATFAGPAPTITPGTSSFLSGSFGGGQAAGSDLVLRYLPAYGDPPTSGGFTSPLWQGYAAQSYTGDPAALRCGNLTQEITFDTDPPSPAAVGATYTPSASATSGLPVTITTATPDVCSLGDDGEVSFLEVGTCTLHADQAGDLRYQPAPQATQSFPVTDGSTTTTTTTTTTQPTTTTTSTTQPSTTTTSTTQPSTTTTSTTQPSTTTTTSTTQPTTTTTSTTQPTSSTTTTTTTQPTSSTTTTTTTPQTPEERFVAFCYRVVLGRQGDPGGIQYWGQRLEQGTSRERVARYFLTLEEATKDLVDDRYQGWLDRPADPSSLSYWTNQLRRYPDPMPLVTFETNVLASSELYQASGANGPSYIQRLYHLLLGRTANASELNFWSTRLQARGRAVTAKQILTSTESGRRRVVAAFQDLLERTPSSAEVDQFAPALRPSQDLRDVEQKIMDVYGPSVD